MAGTAMSRAEALLLLARRRLTPDAELRDESGEAEGYTAYLDQDGTYHIDRPLRDRRQKDWNLPDDLRRRRDDHDEDLKSFKV